MNQESDTVGAQSWRTGIIMLVFMVISALIIWRLYTLQVVESDTLSERALRQRMRNFVLPAQRGGIYDVNGQPLVQSRSGWDVFADASFMNDKLRATVELADILDLPRAELRHHFEAGNNGRLLAKHITEGAAEEIRELKLQGVYLRRSYDRSFPAGSLAPHVLGFVLADGTGGAGIERRFEDHLSGIPGRESMMVDVRGRPLLHLGTRTAQPTPGGSVYLTINAAIQAEAEAALQEAVEKHNPKTASIVVLRPGSGEVVAMASYPTFDPQDLPNANRDHFRNNALAFVYESGSVMKPLIAGAAVADGHATWGTRIFCENGIYTIRVGRGRRTIKDHSYKKGGHQWLTITEGIAKSDNILMAKLGMKIGPERMYHWVHEYGLGGKTGIELPGENTGMMLPQERWDVINSSVSVSIGHEMSVTPLQMAAAHAAVANRGVWMTPRVVSRLRGYADMNGRARDVPVGVNRVARRILSEQDALAIQEGMVAVMKEGTGRRVQLDGWSSAGKTGTTQKLIPVNGRLQYSNKHHIGSFVCWAPATPAVEPEFLALVTVDEPTKGGYYGGSTAGPVVKRVLEFALEHESIPKDEASLAMRERQ